MIHVTHTNTRMHTRTQELNKTQKDMSAWLSERMMQSARKSFFSSKFLLKGLDAYKVSPNDPPHL
jgi:hypothetical protein